MAYSEENIQEFFNSLVSAGKERQKATQQLAETTNKLLQIELKSAKADKKEQKDEQRHQNRLKQLQARAEKDQDGPFHQMFGGNKAKSEGKKINTWLLAALGLGGAAAAGGWLMSDDPNAKKIRDKIGEFIQKGVDKLKEELQKAVDQAVQDLKSTITKWGNKQLEGTGLGGVTTPGQQELETQNAEGTRQEKIQQLREEIDNSNWFDNITGALQERREQLYYLESGEVMQYGGDFRMGGGDGSRGRGIVSGDVGRAINETAGVTRDDKKKLKELDTMIRDRRELNDKVHKANKEDLETREELKEALEKKDSEIGSFYEENAELTKVLEGIKNERLLSVEKKQTGGIINVPGYGDGDKVPMLLPPESFVLNKKASRHFQKRQTGGFVEAVKHIKKDEALSSLTKGTNDWIRPGGNSVRSKTPWSNVNADTPIYAYLDSVGVPTIGWGNTYYDDISAGKQKVKMGDQITKGKADQIMLDNVKKLAKRYTKQIPNWKKMSNTQRAGLLSMGYNAPNFYGAYKGITAALDSGMMDRVRENLTWGGPSKTRIRESQEMMRKGPQNLNAIVGPKIVGPKIVGHKKVGTGNALIDGFNKFIGRQNGGVVDVPGYGDGDKVPMLLPSGSFVLNREASQRLQNGGVVGAGNSHQRFMEANSNSSSMVIPPPKVVVVKRRAIVKTPKVSDPNAGYNMGSGSRVNIVEQSSQLHRIQSGASV